MNTATSFVDKRSRAPSQDQEKPQNQVMESNSAYKLDSQWEKSVFVRGMTNQEALHYIESLEDANNALSNGILVVRNNAQQHQSNSDAFELALAEIKGDLDDGETIDVLVTVIFHDCCNDLGLLDADIEEAKSLWDLDGFIRQHPQGDKLYFKLPRGIKAVGGPAATKLLLDIEKHRWNLRTHWKLPENEEESIQRLNEQYQASSRIPDVTSQYFASLDPKLRQAIQSKIAKDIADEQQYLVLKMQTLQEIQQRMEDFLQSRGTSLADSLLSSTPPSQVTTSLSADAPSFSPTSRQLAPTTPVRQNATTVAAAAQSPIPAPYTHSPSVTFAVSPPIGYFVPAAVQQYPPAAFHSPGVVYYPPQGGGASPHGWYSTSYQG